MKPAVKEPTTTTKPNGTESLVGIAKIVLTHRGTAKPNLAEIGREGQRLAEDCGSGREVRDGKPRYRAGWGWWPKKAEQKRTNQQTGATAIKSCGPHFARTPV